MRPLPHLVEVHCLDGIVQPCDSILGLFYQIPCYGLPQFREVWCHRLALLGYHLVHHIYHLADVSRLGQILVESHLQQFLAHFLA